VDEEAPRPPREYSDAERPTAATVRDDGAPADIDPARLDFDGLKILNRLHRFGHQAYFVGGCVRDLLAGHKPKDFDIATSALPGQVRSLFRNCRLIGRRFRLAHVYFRGGKIIEVSTFRANPAEVEDGEELPEDLLITRDNVFGTAEQDARRRDFTVNGLFYDIQRGRVIDYVDGLPDLRAATMRTIGNPEIRMREDPVRILRAVRFAARLDFEIDPATYAALEGAVEDLPRCAPPRLLEEVLRLMRGGHSRRAFELLHALGALRVLLPPVAEHLDRSGQEGAADLWSRLGALDARLQQSPVDDSIIIAVMLHPLARNMPEAADSDMSPGEAVDQLLEQMVQTARLPRRLSDRARMLLWAEGVLSGERRRRRSLASFRRHPVFTDALTLLEIGADATGKGAEIVARWKEGKVPELAPPVEGEGRKKRRRRRRRRGGKGEAEGSVPPPAGNDG
jgi:poly(A) polymerase